MPFKNTGRWNSRLTVFHSFSNFSELKEKTQYPLTQNKIQLSWFPAMTLNLFNIIIYLVPNVQQQLCFLVFSVMQKMNLYYFTFLYLSRLAVYGPDQFLCSQTWTYKRAPIDMRVYTNAHSKSPPPLPNPKMSLIHTVI